MQTPLTVVLSRLSTILFAFLELATVLAYDIISSNSPSTFLFSTASSALIFRKLRSYQVSISPANGFWGFVVASESLSAVGTLVVLLAAISFGQLRTLWTIFTGMNTAVWLVYSCRPIENLAFPSDRFQYNLSLARICFAGAEALIATVALLWPFTEPSSAVTVLVAALAVLYNAAWQHSLYSLWFIPQTTPTLPIPELRLFPETRTLSHVLAVVKWTALIGLLQIACCLSSPMPNWAKVFLPLPLIVLVAEIAFLSRCSLNPRAKQILGSDAPLSDSKV